MIEQMVLSAMADTACDVFVGGGTMLLFLLAAIGLCTVIRGVARGLRG